MMTTNGNLLKKPRELQKPQEKNRHWWNIKNLSVNEQSLNLEQIYHFEYNKTSQESDLQQISSLSLQNIPTDTEALQDENQIHETLFVKKRIRHSKGQTSRTRSVEERRCLHGK